MYRDISTLREFINPEYPFWMLRQYCTNTRQAANAKCRLGFVSREARPAIGADGAGSIVTMAPPDRLRLRPDIQDR